MSSVLASPPQPAVVHPLLALRRMVAPQPQQTQPKEQGGDENVLPLGGSQQNDNNVMMKNKESDNDHQQRMAAEAMAKKRKHHQLILQQQKHQQQRASEVSTSSADTTTATTTSSSNNNHNQQEPEPTKIKKRHHHYDCHPLLRQDSDDEDYDSEYEEEPGPIILSHGNNHYGHHGHRAEYEEYHDEVPYKIPKKVKSTTTTSSSTDISYGNNNTRAIPAEKKQFVEEICWRELHENGVPGLRNLTAGTVWDEHSHFFGKGGYKFPSFSALYNRTRTAVIMQHTGQKSITKSRSSSTGSTARGYGGPERKKPKTSTTTAAAAAVVKPPSTSYVVSSGSNERIPSEKKRIVEMECKKVLESDGPEALRQINPAIIWDAHYGILSQGGYGFDAFRMLVRRVRMHLLGEKEERRSVGATHSGRRKSTARAVHRTTSTTAPARTAAAAAAAVAAATLSSRTMTSSNSSRSIPEEKKLCVEQVCRNEIAVNGIESLKKLLPAVVWDEHYELLSSGNYEFSAFKAYYTRARAAVIEDHVKRNRSKPSSSSNPNSSRAIPLEKKRLVFTVCTNELNAGGVDGLRRLLPAQVWDEHYNVLSKGNYEFSAFKAYYTRARATVIEDHLKAIGGASAASSSAPATAAVPATATATSSSSARQLRQRHHHHHHQNEEDQKQQQQQPDQQVQQQMKLAIDSLKQQVEDLSQTVQLHTEQMEVAKTNQQQLERAIGTTSSTTEANNKASVASDKKFCIFCGTNLPLQAAFCCSCGEKQCTFPSSSSASEAAAVIKSSVESVEASSSASSEAAASGNNNVE